MTDKAGDTLVIRRYGPHRSAARGTFPWLVHLTWYLRVRHFPRGDVGRHEIIT
jgi:hypothetical protein